MKANNPYRHYLSLFAIFAIACSSLGTGSGGGGLNLNGDSFVQVKVSADPNSTTVGNALVSNDVTFTEARVVIRDIEFRPSANCSGSGEVNYEGPYVVNILNQKAIPSLDEVQLAKGKYCKFRFKLDKLQDNELPVGISSSDEIIDQSVIIKGTDNTSSTPFIVTLDQNQTYELKSENTAGFELIPNDSNTVFLVFNLSKLFDTVDLSTLDVNSGTIYIDKDHNQTAFDIIKDNLEKFSTLQQDANDNDSLDTSDDVIASVQN